MKFLLSLFLLIFFGCLNTSTAQIKPAQVSSDAAKITGKTIALISDGDFVYPTLSPDGNQIAYSRVVVKNKTELTEIIVKDLRTNRAVVLLTPQTSKKYAAYAAFVSGFEWVDNNKLTATISDGDVDSTDLTFNVKTRRIIKTEYSGDEDYPGSLVQKDLEFAVKPVQQIAPQMPVEVVNEALQTGNGAFAVEKRGVVFQHHYFKYDDHIHFFDFQAKTRRILLEVNDSFERLPSLLGGFALKNKIIFALDARTGVRIYEHYNGETKLLIEHRPANFKPNNFGFVIKYRTPEKILFMLQPSSTIAEVRGTLWIYDANGLRQTSDQSNLLDADVNAKAKRIAFSYWEKEKRHIAVKELVF